MNWKLFIISLVCAFANIVCEPIVLSPCPREDPTCLTELTRVLYKAIVTGNEALNIPPSDPLYQGLIEGDLPTVEYKITKSTLVGFKDCEIETVRITEDRNGTIFQMFCPYFKMTGRYEIDGELIVIPIRGDGNFIIETHECHITITSDIQRLSDSRGRSYMFFKNLRVESDLRGGMEANITNLFDGNEDLAQKARNFIHDNWKQVADFLQTPIVEASVKCLFRNLNKVIKTVPVDNL